jgi:hypothetical protein
MTHIDTIIFIAITVVTVGLVTWDMCNDKDGDD